MRHERAIEMNELGKIVHIRLLVGRMRNVNLCKYSLPVIRLPKRSELKNIDCIDCIKRWKEERE